MGTGNHAHTRAQRPQVGRLTAIWAGAVLQDVGADDALLNGIEGVPQILGVVALGVRQETLAERVALVVALGLGQTGLRRERGSQVVTNVALCLGGSVGVDFLGGVGPLLLAQVLLHLLLQLHDLEDRLLAQRHRVDQELLGHLGGFSLHHHDRVRGPSHHEVELALLELLKGGLQNQLIIDAANPHRTHGAIEGHIGDRQRGAGGDGAQGVRRVLHVGGEDREHDLGIVHVALGEQGPQRSVRQPGRKHRRCGGAPFAPEEGAGDPARGIEPLLKFHRKREEIDPPPWAARRHDA